MARVRKGATVVLRCPRCRATKEVAADDQTAREYGHYCTCGSVVPMLVHKVTTGG